MKKTGFILLLVILFTTTVVKAQKFDDFKAFSSGKGAITAVCYSPDGNSFASGNDQGMLLIRNAVTGDILHVLRTGGHTTEINHLAYHPNGQYLASTSRDGYLKIWDLHANKVVYEVNAKTQNNNAGAYHNFAFFSPDGNVVLFGGTDGIIYAARPFLPNQAPGIIVNNNGQPFTCADYATTGNYLIVGSKQGIKVIDFFSKKVVKTFIACPDEVMSIKFTPDNERVGSLCKDGTFTLWDVNTGISIKQWKVTTAGPPTQLAFSPDGQYLVTGDTKNHVKVWNMATMDINSDLTGHQAAVRSVYFAPNSKFILTGGNDDQIKMWQWRKLLDNETLPTPPPTPPTPPAPPMPQAPPVVATPPETKAPPKPAVPNLEDVKLTYTTRNIPDSLGDRKVTPGRRLVVDNEDLELWVWDEEYEDGDIISLYFNDEWILREHLLTNKKLKLKVKINRNADNYLILYAHNEGTRPPNTAALTILDGKTINKVALTSNMKRCDALNFKFRK